MTYTAILFPSTNHAIRAEAILKQAGSGCKLIPVPRHISSDCGVCLRIAREDQVSARAALDSAAVACDNVHDC
jgi:hypothetical protein